LYVSLPFFSLSGCLGQEGQEATKEGPSSLLFALFFLAQHYDWLGDIPRALNLIDEAINHTPTLINLYIAKGRIYKVWFRFAEWHRL